MQTNHPNLRREEKQLGRIPKGFSIEDIEMIEQIVSEGRQKDFVEFFESKPFIPHRIGEWEVRVNSRIRDGIETHNLIVLIPLTVRARGIYEKGQKTLLKSYGYSEEEANMYYKYAWGKKYIWTIPAMTVVKELIDTYRVVVPLDRYVHHPDPRRLASELGIPKNPYEITHEHFLIALGLAKQIIRHRNREIRKQLDAVR